MAYFFILPAYGALLIALIAAAVIARFTTRFRMASGYIVAGAVGTLIGFIAVNIVVWLIGVVPIWLSQKFTVPGWLQQPGKYFVAATLIFGPFIGSAFGVLSGFAAGFYVVYRRKRHTPNRF